MLRYFIKTYGCQMNVADSEKLAAALDAAGYARLKTPGGDADIRGLEACGLILVNTCVVRQHAEDRAAGYVTSLKGLKEKNPRLKIALCGCFVTEPGREVAKQFPHVDWFIPPNSPEKLIEYLGAGHRTLDPKKLQNATTYVTIMHGCDNFCSYCVVPYVRGREFSRPLDEVLAEIKGLIEQGTTDITLLGQNVNSYRYGLANLLNKIHSFDIRHLSFVIRFMTSHPKDMSDEIIETAAELPCVAKEFHLPAQSGDDEILRKMNRGYTAAYYRGRIAKIRSLLPRARITTDMMVGFPGETEEQFQNSLALIKEIKFKAVNMFAYSPRPQTTAAKMPGDLPEGVKQERLQRLIAVVREIVSVV